MNKTAIKNFAVWARRKLISEITYKASLIGINEKGIAQPLSISTGNIQFFDIGTGKPNEISDHEIKQRNALVKRIREKESTSDYKTAFQFVIEEVAYTWFNRLIAIRFMEVNDYLPSRIRVLSSETPAKSEPDMVTTPFDTDIVFSAHETDRIMQLKQENKLDELFRMLFIKQCNKLNEVLPELFEKTADYTELLLPISFTDSDGVVSHLINDIAEEDFTEAVEIIGWMYQYYNTEPKDEVYGLLDKKIKITKERIPAATQLFTPDWIVRYMVENSLGRLWVDGHPNDDLKSEWKYYLEQAEQEESVKAELEKIKAEHNKINPEEIKIIDPCMGSGHILVYAFDVLIQIYESQGYTRRDAVSAIIENNLYGLDIDDRAYQLAYFAVMMKARKYDRRFFTRDISPNLYSFKESNNINHSHLQFFGWSLSEDERNQALQQIYYLLNTFQDSKEYGSILNIDKCNWELLNRFLENFQELGQMSLDSVGLDISQLKLKELTSIARVMCSKYDVVVTNPPYMGSRKGMNLNLKRYVKKNYPDSKSDLYSCFIEKCLSMSSQKYVALITQQSFMFTDDYKELRLKIINNNVIDSMVHLGADAFPEINGQVVQTSAFVLFSQYSSKNHVGTYVRLVDYSCNEKVVEFENKINKHYAPINKFFEIKANPFCYWLSPDMLSCFKRGKSLESFGNPKQGMATGKNEQFLRYWFEVDINKIGFDFPDIESFHTANKLYIPYNKGGKQRKWFGNNDYVIKFDKINYEILRNQGNHLPSRQFYCLECMTWSDISGRSFATRYTPQGFVFDVKGSCGFPAKNNLFFSLALLNSKLTPKFIDALNPTTTTQVGDLKRIPVIVPEQKKKHIIDEYSKQCVELSMKNYNFFESSWDFKLHPLVALKDDYKVNEHNHISNFKLEKIFDNWNKVTNSTFNKLKNTEEDINRIFIEVYKLQNELSPEVIDKEISVHKANLQNDIKDLLSYAVGCMLGRYSIDAHGLSYAGGAWDDSKYATFIPDKDNCILITDEEYFEDDILGRFVEFVKRVYGAETLEENLDFIAKALGNKGNTSREIIRNYFVKDFYKDHLKTYQKRPIYWLYDSGKQDGFKALVYMHRYTADTTGIVRVDYLHKMQKIYTSEIDRMIDVAENSNNAREIAQAEKHKEKLVKQLKETKEYDEKIAHLAISRIAIDLDDGVKVNYEKVQTGQDGNKFDILSKI